MVVIVDKCRQQDAVGAKRAPKKDVVLSINDKSGSEMISRCRKRMSFLRRASGFTLIEVMVAMTILLLVILPLASLYVKSLTVIQNAALYSQAIQLGQERIDICQAVDYHSLYYYNELFTPGFPYDESPLNPPLYDANGKALVPDAGNAYDNRINPDLTSGPFYFDPTDSDNEGYPVPVYRDYYNNYTGACLDPNFDGLCDDDLNGNGQAGILANPPDMSDIEIATNNKLTMYSDPQFAGTPAAALGNAYVPGDGLYDTVVEGSYVSSMDPMYRKIRITECPSPIIDYGLQYDKGANAVPAIPDYKHREDAYKNFIRMTTFIDPTPTLGNPRFVNTWVDQLYMRDRQVVDNYTALELQNLRMCLERDLPIQRRDYELRCRGGRRWEQLV